MPVVKDLNIDSILSLPFIDDGKLSYVSPDGDFSMQFCFLDDNVIHIKSKGAINRKFAEQFNIIQLYIENAFKEAKIPPKFFFIHDSLDVKQYLPVASRIIKDFVDKRLENGTHQHLAIISKDFMAKLFVKTSNFSRKRKTSSVHPDFTSAANYIQKLNIHKPKQVTVEDKSVIESDKEKIKRLEYENNKLKTELSYHVSDITSKIKSISTKENSKPFLFEFQNSELAPIYHALNFLNFDMQLMVRNLQDVNEELEEKVKKRVSQFESIEKRLQSLLSFSNDFICLLNTDYSVDYINTSLFKYIKALYGIEIKVGQKWNNSLPEEAKEFTFDLLEDAKKHKEGRKYIAAKNIHIDFTATVIIENDIVNGYLIIGRNISDFTETLNQLIKSKERYKFITDNINDVIWTHNEDHSLNFISASIKRQRGFTIEEYVNLRLEETMTIDSANKLNDIIKNKKYMEHSKENPLLFHAEYLKKDGSIMYGESYAYPVYNNGKFNSILGITRDVTDKILNLNQIEQQNSELETILNNTDEQIISLNRNFEYVTMNEVARNFIRNNYNKEPQIGDSILDYMSVANKSKIQLAFRKVLNGEKFHYVFRFPKDGKMEYLDSRFRPIYLNNEVFGISIFIKNISENIYTQIALKDNEQRLKRITNNALEGVWEYSINNKNLYLSSRMRELINYTGDNSIEEFVKYTKSVMENEHHDTMVQSIIKSANTKEEFEESVNIKLDGEKDNWFLIRASVSSNDKGIPQTISGVLIDISSQKEQEDELKKAKEKAEEMMQLKSNFLANMSHEVRTPLNGILGVTQLLEKEGLPEEIQYYLTLQKESGHRLLDTINNILSISRLDSTREDEELSNVELNNFIKNNIDPFRILAKQKNIEIKLKNCCDELMIPMNEHLFYQVFNNLMGNAIKFTMHGSIEVSTDNTNGYAHLTIEDTGIGISPDFIDKIFDVFEQESTGISRNFEGSGLGLAIVKRYIDKIGGEIKVESEKNKGTKFTLLLPLQKGEAEKRTI